MVVVVVVYWLLLCLCCCIVCSNHLSFQIPDHHDAVLEREVLGQVDLFTDLMNDTNRVYRGDGLEVGKEEREELEIEARAEAASLAHQVRMWEMNEEEDVAPEVMAEGMPVKAKSKPTK